MFRGLPEEVPRGLLEFLGALLGALGSLLGVPEATFPAPRETTLRLPWGTFGASRDTSMSPLVHRTYAPPLEAPLTLPPLELPAGSAAVAKPPK